MSSTPVAYEEINEEFYDEQARSFNPIRRWFHVNRYRIINNLVKSKFRNGMKILDLGCGSCNWNLDGMEVFGIDLNEGLLKLAKLKKRIYDYTVAGSTDSGVKDGSFDIVVASEVIEHIPDYGRMIDDIYRILKPAGFAVISVPFDTALSLWKYLFFLQCLFQGYILGNSYYRKWCGHVNYFSPDTIKEAFLKRGFDMDISFTMRGFTIFLVAQKKGMPQEYLSCDDITIILPTLNEGPNIKDALDELVSYYKGARIIVSDDGSKDETKDITLKYQDKNVYFLDRKDTKEHGLTASVIAGIEMVRSKYFVVMDADGQHPWQKAGELINQLRLGSALVVCSRVKVQGKWPLQRKILSYAGTFLGKISLLIRNKTCLSYDILTGFFGAEADFWNKIAHNAGNRDKFRMKGYKVLFDFLKIAPKDTSFTEIYYEFQTRKKASSKINIKVNLEYFKSLFTW